MSLFAYPLSTPIKCVLVNAAGWFLLFSPVYGAGEDRTLSQVPLARSGIPADKVLSADGSWSRVLAPVDGLGQGEAYQRLGHASVEIQSWQERWKRQFRDRGLEFWERYPSDSRRWQWLRDTLWNVGAPAYWQDLDKGVQAAAMGDLVSVPIDGEAKARWDKKYVELRAAYLASPDVSARDKDALRRAELRQRSLDAVAAVARGEQVNLNYLFSDALDFINQEGSYGWGESILDYFFYCAGISLTERDHEAGIALIAAMKFSPVEEVRQLAARQEQMAQLRQHPMEVRGKTLDGRSEADLASLRGQVVLVEVWSIGCSACVEVMPRIESLYQKYRDQGFAVLGVCVMDNHLDEPARPDVVKKNRVVLLKELKQGGVTWPNIGLGDGDDIKNFCQRYGINGVPDLFLLDRSGRLLTREVWSQKQMESQVRKALGLSSVEPEGSGARSSSGVR